MKAFLHKIRKKIVRLFAPELRDILEKNIALDWIAKVAVDVTMGDASKIYPPYNINSVKIGKGTYISSNSRISLTTIGKFCSIGPNLVCGWGIHPTNGISTSPYFYSTAKQNGQTVASQNLIEERKPITIGNDVFIGANVTILDGVTIGDGAIIGAGAVVSKDIPDYAIAVGSPIVIKKYRFTQEQIAKLKAIAWWDFNDDQLKEVNRQFFDVDAFINQYS